MTTDLTPEEADAAITMAAALAADHDAPALAPVLVLAAARAVETTRNPRVWDALTEARKEPS